MKVKKCTKKSKNFCDVCAHLWLESCYYNQCKNPPIHYIVFTNPIVKIPSPKKTADRRLSFLLCMGGARRSRIAAPGFLLSGMGLGVGQKAWCGKRKNVGIVLFWVKAWA